MANCCGELINCEQLVNIRFLKDLANRSRIPSCLNIQGPDIIDICCSISKDDFVPGYSELSAGTFTPIRVIYSNPELDVNGFVYSPEEDDKVSICCSGVVKLRRSKVSLETTSAISNTHIIKHYPDHCNWSYEVDERKEWRRDVYKCDGDDISNTYTTVTAKTTHTGELVRTSNFVTSSGSTDEENSIENNWYYSFETVTLLGNTYASCSESYSSETVLSAETYNYGYEFMCPKIVPCVGGTYEILRINNFSEISGCSEALSINITYIDIEESEGSEVIKSDDTWNTLNTGTVTGDTISIIIPKNTNGKVSGGIEITATVWGNEVTNRLEFTRNLCEWTPEYTIPSQDCSVIMGDEEWINENEYIHEYKNN